MLLSTACRSIDDDVAREQAELVLASGDGVITKRNVPETLQGCLALTMEAKRCLRDSRPSAEERARLCEAVVRAGATGAADVEPVAAALLRAAAALRANLKSVFESNMDDVFIAVVEDRFGAFDDEEGFSEQFLPALRR